MSSVHAHAMDGALKIIARRNAQQEENHRFVKQLDAVLEPARLFEHTTLPHIAKVASQLSLLDGYHHQSMHRTERDRAGGDVRAPSDSAAHSGHPGAVFTTGTTSKLLASATGTAPAPAFDLNTEIMHDVKKFERIVKATKPKPASELIAKPSAPVNGTKLVLVKPSVLKTEVPSLTETAMDKSTDTSRSIKVELIDDDAQVHRLLDIAKKYEALARKMHSETSKIANWESMLSSTQSTDVASRLKARILKSESSLLLSLHEAAEVHKLSLGIKVAAAAPAAPTPALEAAPSPLAPTTVATKAEDNLLKARKLFAKYKASSMKTIVENPHHGESAPGDSTWRARYDSLMASPSEEDHFIARDIKSRHDAQQKIQSRMEKERREMAKTLQSIE